MMNLSASACSAAVPMIRVFCDESSNGVFLMAALISSAEQWEGFANAWSHALATPPAVRYFKHHEAKALAGEFDGWPEQARDEKILSLAEVICKHRPLYGISTGLILKKFETELDNSVVPRKTLKTILEITEPYQFAFFEVVCRVLQVQEERGSDEIVDFVFDEHGSLEGCVALYRELKTHYLSEKQQAIAGNALSGRDTELPALQAADLLAGQLTASLRLGKHEPPLRMLRECIEIFVVPVPRPSHMALGGLIQALNVVWSTKKLSRKKED